MSIASSLQAGALKVLQTLGRPFTASRPTQLEFSTETGDVLEQANTTYSGYGYPGNYNIQEVNNTTVLSTDIKFTMYSVTKPLVDDLILINNLQHRIMSVQDINVQSPNVVYRCQLRV